MFVIIIVFAIGINLKTLKDKIVKRSLFVNIMLFSQLQKRKFVPFHPFSKHRISLSVKTFPPTKTQTQTNTYNVKAKHAAPNLSA